MLVELVNLLKKMLKDELHLDIAPFMRHIHKTHLFQFIHTDTADGRECIFKEPLET